MSDKEQGRQGGYGGYNNAEPYPRAESSTITRYSVEVAAATTRDAGSYHMTEANPVNVKGQYEVLDEARKIDRAIDEAGHSVTKLIGLYDRYLNATNISAETPLCKEIESVSGSITLQYKELVSRVRALKSHPESGNQQNTAQVGKVDRALKNAIFQYQVISLDHQKKLKAQITRDYKTARPDMTDMEVKEALANNNNQQVFQETLLHCDRRGDVQIMAQNNKRRHTEVEKIEHVFEAVVQLFQDLEVLVVQQGITVTEGEQNAMTVRDHVEEVNTDLGIAVEKAEDRRTKQWYCFGISVLIIIIVIIVITVVVVIVKVVK